MLMGRGGGMVWNGWEVRDGAGIEWPCTCHTQTTISINDSHDFFYV